MKHADIRLCISADDDNGNEDRNWKKESYLTSTKLSISNCRHDQHSTGSAGLSRSSICGFLFELWPGNEIQDQGFVTPLLHWKQGGEALDFLIYILSHQFKCP
jgi:hypothetical protein